MGKYLKQGFVRELAWMHAKEEISYSKMVNLMEEECIKNYKAGIQEDIIELETNLTQMFDSDQRVAMALLEYIRENKYKREK